MPHTWSDFSIKEYAKYLGFVVGLERKELSWVTPLDKFMARARTWRAIGGGLFLTILAYRTYIFPVITFLLQLDRLPDDWDKYERKVCNILFPGPRGWATSGAMRNLKSLGLQTELPNAVTTADAAKCRVHRDWRTSTLVAH